MKIRNLDRTGFDAHFFPREGCGQAIEAQRGVQGEGGQAGR